MAKQIKTYVLYALKNVVLDHIALKKLKKAGQKLAKAMVAAISSLIKAERYEQKQIAKNKIKKSQTWAETAEKAKKIYCKKTKAKRSVGVTVTKKTDKTKKQILKTIKIESN